jgi:ribosomal protein S18
MSAHSYVSVDSSNSKSKPKINARFTCQLCNGNHAIYKRFKFLNLSISDRIKFINDKRLCKNCLRSQHSISDCIFSGCKQCSLKHNTLLCLATQNNNIEAQTK